MLKTGFTLFLLLLITVGCAVQRPQLRKPSPARHFECERGMACYDSVSSGGNYPISGSEED